MPHAFVCDAVHALRPLRRRALRRAHRRPGRRCRSRRSSSATPAVDWGRSTRRAVRLRQPGRRGQPQRRAHGVLLAGLPIRRAGATINRLCGSGLDAVGSAARAIKSGEAGLMIAGGVESMSRAPFVMPKADSAFSRSNAVYDDDRLALRQPAHEGALRRRRDARDGRERGRRVRHLARGAGRDGARVATQGGRGAAERFFDAEIVPVTIAQKGEPLVVSRDEHPARDQPDALARLKGDRAPGRHGDRGQRLGRQRRRLCAAAGERGRRRAQD